MAKFLVSRIPKRGKAEALRTLACFVEATSSAAARRLGGELLKSGDKYDSDWKSARAEEVVIGNIIYL